MAVTMNWWGGEGDQYGGHYELVVRGGEGDQYGGHYELVVRGREGDQYGGHYELVVRGGEGDQYGGHYELVVRGGEGDQYGGHYELVVRGGEGDQYGGHYELVVRGGEGDQYGGHYELVVRGGEGDQYGGHYELVVRGGGGERGGKPIWRSLVMSCLVARTNWWNALSLFKDSIKLTTRQVVSSDYHAYHIRREYSVCVCVCVCACVRACVRACVCVCVTSWSLLHSSLQTKLDLDLLVESTLLEAPLSGASNIRDCTVAAETLQSAASQELSQGVFILQAVTERKDYFSKMSFEFGRRLHEHLSGLFVQLVSYV